MCRDRNLPPPALCSGQSYPVLRTDPRTGTCAGERKFTARESGRRRAARRQHLDRNLPLNIGFSLWLVTFLAPETWLRFAVWFVIGLVIYLLYGYRKSAMAEQE